MASSMSNSLEDSLINAIFRSVSFTSPTSMYVALCTAAPTDSSTGSTIVEPSTGGYARVNAGVGTSNWSATSSGDGTTHNLNDISWTASGGNFGVITHIALVSASSAGSVYFWGALTSSKNILDTDSLLIPAGSLTVQIDA